MMGIPVSEIGGKCCWQAIARYHATLQFQGREDGGARRGRTAIAGGQPVYLLGAIRPIQAL